MLQRRLSAGLIHPRARLLPRCISSPNNDQSIKSSVSPDPPSNSQQRLPLRDGWRENLIKRWQMQDLTEQNNLPSNSRKESIQFLLDLTENLFAQRGEKSEVLQVLEAAQYEMKTRHLVIDLGILRSVTHAALGNHLYSLVPRLLHTTAKLGVVVTEPKLYEEIAQWLKSERKWRELEAVIKFCNKSGVKFTSTLLDCQLRLLLHHQRFSSLSLNNVLSKFSKHQCKPTRSTFNLMIEACITNHDLQSCRTVMDAMESAGLPLNESTYEFMLSRLIAVGPNLEIEFRTVESLRGLDPRLDTTILNSLIRLRSIDGDDHTLKNYLIFLKSGVKGTNDRHSTMFSLQPNTTTISLLIEHFGRRRDIERALETFYLLPKLNLRMSREVIANLVFAYGEAGKSSEAIALVAEICSGSFERKSRLSKHFENLGWSGRFPNHGVSSERPNISIFNALLRSIIPIQGLEGFSTLLDIIYDCDVIPDDDTATQFLIFLEHYDSRSSNYLISILHRLFKAHKIRVRPKIRHINVILHAILKEHSKLVKGPGGWKSSAWFLAQASSRKLPTDPPPEAIQRAESIFSIVNGDKEADTAYLPQLAEILRWIASEGLKPDQATYSMRMLYSVRVAKNPQAVHALFRDMLESGLRPNAYHIAAIIEGYCVSGQLEEAKRALEMASRNKIHVNRVLYTLLICTYGNHGRPEEGLDVFQQMRQDGVKPDLASLEAVIRGYFLVQRYAKARKVLYELVDHVAPPGILSGNPKTLGEALEVLRTWERSRLPNPPTAKDGSTLAVEDILSQWRSRAETHDSSDIVGDAQELRALTLNNHESSFGTSPSKQGPVFEVSHEEYVDEGPVTLPDPLALPPEELANTTVNENPLVDVIPSKRD